MDRKDRKNRLVMYNEGLTSEITTEYKIGFMGTIAGIIFHANFDWQEGSTKTDFIVRPIKNRDELLGGKWIRAPFFEEELHSDPVLN